MGFDFQHGFMVIDLLAAIGTIVEFHHRDDILPFLVDAGEVAYHALAFVAATGWANFDLKFVVHGLLHGFQLHQIQFVFSHAGGQVENLNANHAVVLVKVKDHTWLDFFRVNDFGFVEVEVEGVAFFVNFEFHLRHLKSGNFHLPLSFACVADHRFKAFGDIIGDPVRAALGADHGGYISHNDDAETQVNGKGGCAKAFRPAAFGTLEFIEVKTHIPKPPVCLPASTVDTFL